MKVCPKCGQENESTAVLCADCGAELGPALPPTPNEKLELLHTFSTAAEADIVASRLRTYGIESMVGAAAGMLVQLESLEGVKLFVPAAQLSEAKAIIETDDQGADSPGT
jgi:hypothetical protein